MCTCVWVRVRVYEFFLTTSANNGKDTFQIHKIMFLLLLLNRVKLFHLSILLSIVLFFGLFFTII